MGPRNGRISVILALVAAAATAYWWWTRPERQIRAIVDDVAAALTYQARDSGLAALAAIATLEPHLAEGISVQFRDAPVVSGRDAVVTAGARLRARTPAMRVRFFDTRITFDGDRLATLVTTAEAAVTTAAGEQRIDVHQITATVTRPANRWLVSVVRVSAS